MEKSTKKSKEVSLETEEKKLENQQEPTIEEMGKMDIQELGEVYVRMMLHNLNSQTK